MELQKEDQTCIKDLREDLTNENFYKMDVIFRPTTKFGIIKDYLTIKGLTYHQHPCSNRVYMCSPDMIYTPVEDQNEARSACQRAMAINMTDSSPVVQQHGGAVSNQFNRTESNTKVVHNISSRFKKEDHFSEKMDEYFSDACRLMQKLVQ